MNTKNVIGNVALFLSGLVLAFILTFLLLYVLPTNPGNEEHREIMNFLVPGLPFDIDFLTLEERTHMIEVKLLVFGVWVLFIPCVLYLFKFGVPKTKYAGYSLLALVAFGAGMSLQGFAGFWVRFHQVFFPQGGWMFPADSTLITLYPEAYFANATLIFAGFVLMIAAFFIGNFKIPGIKK